MQPRKIALAAVLISALCSGTFVLGQQNAAPDDSAVISKQISEAEGDLTVGNYEFAKSATDKFIGANKKAVGNAGLTDLLTSRAVVVYYTGGDPKAEVRLQALQIAQNQRIIELLEQLNAKKN
jgi:hypothetical protein